MTASFGSIFISQSIDVVLLRRSKIFIIFSFITITKPIFIFFTIRKVYFSMRSAKMPPQQVRQECHEVVDGVQN